MARRRLYRPGQTVVLEGEEPDFVGLMEKGVIRVVRGGRQGERQIVGFLETPRLFGHGHDGYRRYALEAAGNVVLYQIRRQTFARFTEQSPQLLNRLMRQELAERDAARELALLLARRRVSQRIALYLLGRCVRDRTAGTGERGGNVGVIVLPVSRRDLSDYLATTPESLSRGLHALERRGAIRMLEPNRLEVTDPHRLSEEAQGSDPVERCGAPSDDRAA